jgi:hypothetical protein
MMLLSSLAGVIAVITVGAGAAPVAAPPAQDLAGVPVEYRDDVISWRLVTNGPVPDTAENRAKYPPLSHAGRRSKAKGH